MLTIYQVHEIWCPWEDAHHNQIIERKENNKDIPNNIATENPPKEQDT